MDSNESKRQLEGTSLSRRRQFLLAGAGVGTAVLAGCTGTADSGADSEADSTSGDDTGGGSESDDESTGDEATSDDSNFRLLISDMPADIGDFDRLDVTFDSARIFDGGEDDGDEGDAQAVDDSDENPDGSGTDETPDGDDGDDNPDGDDTDENPDGDDGNDNPGGDEGDDNPDGNTDEDSTESNTSPEGNETVERRDGFYVLDINDATVDLTQVIGDRAMSVFEGELSEGSYQKIELHVSGIEGIVDGEEAEVKVPSEKLQITTPFEIRAEETVDFVFDINVVKRGQQDRYILTPVISESGVAGEDVDVEEVDDGGGEAMDDEMGTGEANDDETERGEGEGEEGDGEEADGGDGNGSDDDGGEGRGRDDEDGTDE